MPDQRTKSPQNPEETVTMGTGEIDRSLEIEPTDVLKEAAVFYRHFSALRFAIFTVFLAATAALMNAMLGGNGKLKAVDVNGLKSLGVVIAVVMAVMQARLWRHQEHYQTQIRNINSKLAGARAQPAWGWIVISGVGLIHVSVIAFWLVPR